MPDSPGALAARANRHPLAERRFAYAQAAAADGAWLEAADVFEQAIALAPAWTAAWIALGEAWQGAGDRARARDAYRQALRLDPDDAEGAALRLAVLDPTTALRTAASPAYVGALFDAYADRFEAHLTDGLAYRGPANLVAALAAVGRHRFAHAVDLGCGTGLGGMALRPLVQSLTGIDLSAAMVARAEAKAIYDRLAVGTILAFLQGEPAASADLVFAADVFVYVGDLAPILTGAFRLLRQGGTLAFTTQLCDMGITVGPDLRFRHALAYVEDVLDACGFAPLVVRRDSDRRENGRDVPGLVAVAARR